LCFQRGGHKITAGFFQQAANCDFSARLKGEDRKWEKDPPKRLIVIDPVYVVPSGLPPLRAANLSRYRFPPLRSYGIQERDVPTLIEKASRASSTKGNPIALTMDELRQLLSCALWHRAVSGPMREPGWGAGNSEF
jgi:hypothetical protein